MKPTATSTYDLIIIGAGTAGLPAAIFASKLGVRVIVLEASNEIGGTLHLASGQIAAAGTTLQARLGIVDSPERHLADCQQLSGGVADSALLRRIIEEAPATLDWLLAGGLTPLPDHPVTGALPGRPGYSVPRYFWAKEGGRAILEVLRREFMQEMSAGHITLHLNTRATRLMVDATGQIIGVHAHQPGRHVVFHGHQILLSTGGYAMNPTRFRELSGVPAYVAKAAAYSLGDGIDLATSMGSALRGQGLHRAGSGSILNETTFPATILTRIETTPQHRLPWEIWIDDSGCRFVREDHPSIYHREHAIAARPSLRYHVLADERILREAPPLIRDWSNSDIYRHCGQHPAFHCADDLEKLAELIRVNAHDLTNTVAEYNRAVRCGKDPFGREHCPRRIEKGPFYAITQHGHSATSAVGVSVNDRLEVLRANGTPIIGLYAAGEVLGSAATVGDRFVPGMMLTPALSLGRWLGLTLGSQRPALNARA